MRAFLWALQFLTIIPVKPGEYSGRSLGASVVCFPVAGLLIGGCAALAAWCCREWLGLPVFTAGAAAVVCLAAVSGGLHLDGLADTFDALGSRQDKDGMLRIMRDSRIGAFGAAAIAVVLLMKTAGLYAYSGNEMYRLLLLVPLLSRWGCVVMLALFSPAREDGRAASFRTGLTPKAAWFATAIAAGTAAALYGGAGLALMACVGVAAYAAGLFFRRSVGGITGDGIGAVCELNEVMLILCAFAFDRAL